jgi:hypothetical protein
MGQSDITANDLPPGALAELSQVTLALCIPLHWHDRRLPWPKPVTGASSFVLGFDEGLVLVTAAHVYRAYERGVLKNPHLVCQLRTHVLDLRGQLIDIDDDLDIATFRLARAALDEIGGHAVPIEKWPLPEPIEGRGLSLAGFPECIREVYADGSGMFQAYGAQPVVENVSDRQIWTTYDPTRDVPLSDDVPAPPLGFNMSGCSGGIVLMPEWKPSDAAWRLQPVGLIRAGSHDMQVDADRPPIDHIFIARLNRLRPDGSIDREGR